MSSSEESTLFSGWENELKSSFIDNNSLGIALFSLFGDLIFSNPAMNSICPGFNKSNILHPAFEEIITFQESNGLIYSGLITIGEMNSVNTSIETKIYKQDNNLLLIGGINVAGLIEQNKVMHFLNQKVTNLQRQLLHEKTELEVTMRKLQETQQMLVQSEKMNALGKLVAGIAHEINNPISFVYSNLFSLERSTVEISEYINEIDKLVNESNTPLLADSLFELKRANDIDFLFNDITDIVNESKIGIERVKVIVEDLRRFSRLDEAEIKQVDLISSFRSTISILLPEINSKNIEFKFISPESLNVECYPGQLNQALMNVLINAIQAVDNGGEVELTVKDENEFISIEVKDNGCGIPENIADKIFDPFFTTKPVGSGTGLGLSITYKIITELHKGAIHAESKAGEGTVFKISIPKI